MTRRTVAWRLSGDEACMAAIALAAPIVNLRHIGITVRVDGSQVTLDGPEHFVEAVEASVDAQIAAGKLEAERLTMAEA